ncbi:MAG: stress response translation initiation inhibitor YciH [Nanoarchaeota archaeon]|nr:stress response translation initiation inhibitor YciH [Nanoarchaeota archaeon]
MSEIDPITGLPKELGVWENITKEDQKIEINVVRRRFGKLTTVISGFDKSINVKELAKKLKSKLACGGTYKGNAIELQGEHVEKVKQAIIEEGFSPNTITVKYDKRK